MNDQEKWQKVSTSFGIKDAIGNGYYRVRQKAENLYDFAYLVPNPCGDTNPHPQITVEIIAGRAVPIRLLDVEASPLRMLTAIDQQELQAAFSELLDRFLAAKKNAEGSVRASN